jgi:NAD(P)-dependent dehydrogenase (short-subunit alcohol dehydrogenase family)
MRVLVTGSSRGLGLGLCTVLASRGDDVLAACRRPSAELEALAVQVVDGVDVTAEESVPRIREAVGGAPLDLVICNAGVNGTFGADGIEDTDLDAVLRDLDVNAVGVARTVAAASPALHDGATVALITSGSAAPGREKLGYYGYKMSKAALNMFGHVLAAELRPRGVNVLLVSPGPVDTDLLRAVHGAGKTHFDPAAAPSVVEAAHNVLSLIGRASPELSGCWLDLDGTLLVDASGMPVTA